MANSFVEKKKGFYEQSSYFQKRQQSYFPKEWEIIIERI